MAKLILSMSRSEALSLHTVMMGHAADIDRDFPKYATAMMEHYHNSGDVEWANRFLTVCARLSGVTQVQAKSWAGNILFHPIKTHDKVNWREGEKFVEGKMSETMKVKNRGKWRRFMKQNPDPRKWKAAKIEKALTETNVESQLTKILNQLPELEKAASETQLSTLARIRAALEDHTRAAEQVVVTASKSADIKAVASKSVARAAAAA